MLILLNKSLNFDVIKLHFEYGSKSNGLSYQLNLRKQRVHDSISNLFSTVLLYIRKKYCNQKVCLGAGAVPSSSKVSALPAIA